MPPSKKITREQILKAAVEILRKKGAAAVNARSIAARLKCSTKPIYLSFENMQELKSALLDQCNEIYEKYIADSMKSGEFPPYKASGMGYIRFAAEEKEIFRLLFMRDRTGEVISDGKKEMDPFAKIVSENLGISYEDAFLFHVEMWIYVHGVATMAATSYLMLDEETVSATISDIYRGLTLRFQNKKGEKQ